MLASLFAAGGYFMGDNLLRAGPGNERGYFESQDVIDINEDLLDQVIPTRPTDFVRSRLNRHQPRRYQRWIVRPQQNSYTFSVSADALRRMQGQLRSPYCLKDPRFCLTLPAWRDAIADPLFVCVFRDPVETVNSIVKKGRMDPDLRDYEMNRAELLEVWLHMYTNVLAWADADSGEWWFLQYEQVLNQPSLVAELARAVGADFDAGLPDPAMRSVTGRDEAVPERCAAVYAELQRRAGSPAS